MDKKLRIILELIADRFSGGVRSAGGIFKGFVGGIRNGVANAGRALASLAQGFFFVREAIQTVIAAARSLWDFFVGGAANLAKIEQRFIALTGSTEGAAKVMTLAKERALALGKDVEEVANGLGLMASNARDASGAFDFGRLQELNGILEQLAILRPDLPVERIARALNQFLSSGDLTSLEMVMDMPLKSSKALAALAQDMDKSTKEISRGVTSIETGGAQAAGDIEARVKGIKDALTELAPGLEQAMAGMTEKSGMERLQAAARDFANVMGGPVFESLNEIAGQLADLYEQDPEAFREIARALGEGLANVITSLADIDPAQLKETLAGLGESLQNVDWQSISEQIKEVADSFVAIADSIERILGMMGQAGETLGQMNQIAAGAELGGKGVMGGPATGGPSMAERLFGGGNNGQQRVAVDINLNTDMFTAAVRQQADRSVTDGLNAVTEELGGPQ